MTLPMFSSSLLLPLFDYDEIPFTPEQVDQETAPWR